MISALLLFSFLPHLASAQESFSLPAPDSAAVRRIYGIGVFANPASKASVSVDSGILRAEFDLASDSTEGWSVNVGLNIPLTPDREPLNLGRSGGAPMNRLRFEYRFSEKVTDALTWIFDSEVCPLSQAEDYRAWMVGGVKTGASRDWKRDTLEDGDFSGNIWWDPEPPTGYIPFDSLLTRVTALRVEPRSLYSASGFEKGKACTRCVNPTMKHLVMELRYIQIDRLGPSGDTIPLVLGRPKAQVGVAPRPAFRPVDISWHGDVLQIANPARWTSVAVLAPDGRHLRALNLSASQRLDLPPGSYRVLLRGRDGSQAVRNLIRIR